MAERTVIHCDYGSCTAAASIRATLTDVNDLFMCGQGFADDSGLRDLCKGHFALIMGIAIPPLPEGASG